MILADFPFSFIDPYSSSSCLALSLLTLTLPSAGRMVPST
jgi:hypothetical protein